MGKFEEMLSKITMHKDFTADYAPNPMDKTCTLSLLVEDSSGVLSQVTRLFARKGYNIKSAVSGPTNHNNLNRMTIVIEADRQAAEQVASQCRKLLPVIEVKILGDNVIKHELYLLKLYLEDLEEKESIWSKIHWENASMIDREGDIITLAVQGSRNKIHAFLKELEPFETLEVVRTGIVALERGGQTIYDNNKLKEEYNYGKNVLREGL
ncbi:MAG: acetolactate synthase small subunit [Eubacteriales bacterium]